MGPWAVCGLGLLCGLAVLVGERTLPLRLAVDEQAMGQLFGLAGDTPVLVDPVDTGQ